MRQLIIVSFILGFSFSSVAQQTLSERSEHQKWHQAMELWQYKKYSAARDVFRQYVASEQKDELRTVAAHYYIAQAALLLFNDDAEAQYKAFIANYPNSPQAKTAYFDMGIFYYREKQFPKVIEYLAPIDWKTLSPEQQYEGKFKLGYAYFSQQNFSSALPFFDDLKNITHNYTADAAYYAAQINYREGKYQQALSDVQIAEKDENYKRLATSLRAGIYYMLKDYDKAIATAEAEIKQGGNPDQEQLALITAESYYAKNNYEKAATYYAQVKTKLSPAVSYRKGFCENHIKQYDKAVNSLKSIAAKKDTIGQAAAYQLGIAYLNQNNKPFAANSFDHAASLTFDKNIQAEAMLALAKVNYELKKVNEAITILQNLTAQFPESEYVTEANDLLSEAFLNSDNYNAAITELEKITRRSPQINKAYQQITFYKAVQSFNDEKPEEAANFFLKSLEYPIDENLVVAANYWLGESYYLQRKFPEAARRYEKVLVSAGRTSDFYLKARYGNGYALYNSKEFAKALVQFEQYTQALAKAENKQNYNDALLRLADCYYVTKNYGAAVREYDNYIATQSPEQDYAYLQKGVCLALMNRNEEARKAYNFLYQNFPNSRYREKAAFQKAQLDFEETNFSAAIVGFTQLIEKYPNSRLIPFALQKRAISYSNLTQYDKAAEDYKKILNDYPSHEIAQSALQGLQEALGNSGQLDEFNDYLQRYKENNPQSGELESIEFETAKKLYFSEKYSKAVEALNRYVKTYQGTALTGEAMFYLGESYYRLGDWGNAIIWHQKVFQETKTSFVNRALARLAEMTFAQQDFKASLRYNRLLLAQARSKREESNAFTGLMENYFYLKQLDSADYFAEQILTKGNAIISAENKALLYKGKVQHAKGNYDDAIGELLNAVNSAKDQSGAEAQYLIADSFYKQKKYKQSLESLFTLTQEFANYSEWYDKSFLLMAENYIGQNEIFQAKKTLESIVQNVKSESVKKAAAQRLKELNNKEKEAANAEKTADKDNE